MRAFVTGATGFTGGHLARTLRMRGHDVRALVRNPDKAPPLVRNGIEIHRGDLTDAGSLRHAAEGCDVVYHVAACHREARHRDDYYRLVNVEGTRNVLDAADHANVRRFVHCSTVGVHGNVKSVPADENAPFAPENAYETSKLEAELLVHERIRAGLPAAIVRPTAIYGPGDNRFLKLFKLIRGGTFRMIGKGNVYYQMSYVTDLVDGLICCGNHPEALGQAFIVGGRRYRRLRELVACIADLVGRPVPRGYIPVAPVMAAAVVCEILCRPFGIEPILYPRRLSFFTKNHAYSIDKARRVLNYSPKVRLSEGLRRTFDWYREAGWL